MSAPDSPPLGSVHTLSVPPLLDSLNVSVAVTTYQAGKLVLLRPDGPRLNTHFRSFSKPMGFAFERGRFAVGTAGEIQEFHDLPAVARKLDPPGDAAFLPRNTHVTGDVQIHEMVWASRPAGPSELWFVNTRFSCLATRSDLYSFVPRWKPPFVTELVPQDRCHLNGLCLRDGRPRYATALGATNTAGGWRDNKPGGGVVLDVGTNAVIAAGLSMPHSPRYHAGELWVLESGNGGLGTVDEATGRYRERVRLPGFTRGLDFAGPFAFVGLSQVRDSATFGGIAIADTPQADRRCGVWVVDTRHATVAGYVQFTDAVQEIFAVTVLTDMRRPDVLGEDPARVADSYALPPAALELVPAELRQPA